MVDQPFRRDLTTPATRRTTRAGFGFGVFRGQREQLK
jgi:hypothetical protein